MGLLTLISKLDRAQWPTGAPTTRIAPIVAFSPICLLHSPKRNILGPEVVIVMNCPKCEGHLTVVPGKEGRVTVPTPTSYHVIGRPIPRTTVVTCFLSCDSCEFCWR